MADLDWIDNADHPTDSKYFYKKNKKDIYKAKDVASGKVIVEFIWLRSNMYSHRLEETTKAKGRKKSVIKKNITHDDLESANKANANET